MFNHLLSLCPVSMQIPSFTAAYKEKETQVWDGPKNARQINNTFEYAVSSAGLTQYLAACGGPATLEIHCVCIPVDCSKDDEKCLTDLAALADFTRD